MVGFEFDLYPVEDGPLSLSTIGQTTSKTCLNKGAFQDKIMGTTSIRIKQCKERNIHHIHVYKFKSKNEIDDAK